MKRRVLAGLLFFALRSCASTPLCAQINPNVEAGLKPYGSYDSSDFDTVSLTNLNLFVHIPLIAYPQRGSLVWQTYIVYNGKNFYTALTCNPQTDTCTARWIWGNNRVAGTPGVYLINRDAVTWRYQFVSPNNWETVYTWDGSGHETAHLSDGTQAPFDGSGLRIDSSSAIQNAAGDRFGGEDTNGNFFTQPYLTNPLYDTMGRPLPDPSTGTSTSDYTGCTGPLPTTSATIVTYPGYNGGSVQVKTCYAIGTLKTAFNVRITDQYGNRDLVQEFVGGAQFLQTVIVYNGSSWASSPQWSFAFDAGLSGDTNVHYGDLLSVTLPTGGTISYTWGTASGCGSQFSPASRDVTSRTVNANDGLGPQTTSYSAAVPGLVQKDPLGNDTVHVITGLNQTCSLYETETDYYQGSYTLGNLLKKVTTQFQYQADPFDGIGDGTQTVTNVFPTQITTTFNGQQSQVQMSYDTNLTANAPYGSTGGTMNYTMSYGKKMEERDYDYGTPGPQLRRKDYTYLAFNNSSYLAANMLDRIASETVYNGSGAQVAQTTYGYDEYGLQTTSTPQHGAPPYSVRGNRTSVKRWLNTTGGTLNTSTTYFDTGMPYQVTDPKGNVTTYTYSGTYDGAYLTQTTMPATGSVQHIVSAAYDYNTGKIASFTDQNGQVSSYQYDTLWRPTSASYPDGGQLTLLYPDLQTIEVQRKIDSRVKDSFSYVDSLARTKQTKLQSDPQGPVFADTTYDGDGRVATMSNPYRSTGDSTYGITTTAYDSLNRPTSVTKPDGSIVRTAYCGSTTLVTDEANRWRRSTSDALGRLIEVDEPNSLTATVNSNGCPSGGDPIWVTTYGYDALDDLTSVVQGGSRNRSFVYDSLKRLTSSTNPEAGTVTYSYDADGNVATKRDARGITSTYSYDALNRMTGVTYSNGDPSVAYNYDQSTCVGQSPCYNIGRRTTMTDAGGTENLSYDKMGREWGEQRTTNSVTKSTTYAYDVAGDLTTLTYPSGRTITYTYDSAQRPSLAQDLANSVTYAQGTCSNGVGSNGACYAPQGAPTQVKYGTNLTSTTLYNNRLQPCWFYATTGSALPTNSACTGTASAGNILDLKYGFNLSAGDNGNVIGITNSRDTTRSQSFAYDQVNRISSGQTNATTGSNCWGETFAYDQWANLTTIGGVSGYGSCIQDNLGVSATTGNQLSFTGFSYDTSGNMLTDGLNTYGWNAESEIKSAAGVNYTYDGDGNRLQKSSGTIYWYGAGAEILDESDAAGNFTNEYIYFGGRRIARIALQ